MSQTAWLASVRLLRRHSLLWFVPSLSVVPTAFTMSQARTDAFAVFSGDKYFGVMVARTTPRGDVRTRPCRSWDIGKLPAYEYAPAWSGFWSGCFIKFDFPFYCYFQFVTDFVFNGSDESGTEWRGIVVNQLSESGDKGRCGCSLRFQSFTKDESE